ncbi:MAG: hypothetical protein ACKVS5_06435 [Parvularculaceae bacterium]
MIRSFSASVSARAIVILSSVLIAGACAKKEDAPAEPIAAEPVVEAVAEPEVEPMIDAVADAAPIGSANITVTMTNGLPAFGTVSEGACAVGGGSCLSGINLAAAGNVDLTGFPPGDITINVNLDNTVTGAGYSFPSDPYQAVAIVVIPPNSTTAPIPVFGQANWPAEFNAPSVSGATLSFVDKEDDQQAYEYSIQLMRNGSAVVIDPKIKNTGNTTR